MALVEELKRRKVFKVAAAYLVVGWLLIQVASTVAPQLNLPEWAPRLVTFIILLGFPIALVVQRVIEDDANLMSPIVELMRRALLGIGAAYFSMTLMARRGVRAKRESSARP